MTFTIWQQVLGPTAWFRRLSQERGSVAAEYAVLVSLIALVIIAGVIAFGVVVNAMFSNGAASIP